MQQQKIACNSTNSGAIDKHGRLWVWGATKFGVAAEVDNVLAKKPDAKKNAVSQYNKPVRMDIRIEFQYMGKNGRMEQVIKEEHRLTYHIYSLLDPLPRKGYQVYAAQQLSFGSYHAGVVCDDVSTPGKLEPLP